MRIYKALDVALYVTDYCNDKNVPISNLQLQKILYYIQAAFLVEKNRVCFNDDILHWNYGPVIKEVYYQFRGYGYNSIPKSAIYTNISFNGGKNKVEINKISLDKKKFNPNDLILIDKVVDSYKCKSPFELVDKTHEEGPWRDTASNDIITIQSIKEYYSKFPKKIYGGCK